MSSEVTDVVTLEAEQTDGGVIGEGPALVFQMSPVLSLAAFSGGNDVLVKVTSTVNPQSKEATLTEGDPTASLDYSLYVGNGWMQLNDGTIDLELQTEEGKPARVLATATFDTCDSSTGKCFGTLGGTYVLPL